MLSHCDAVMMIEILKFLMDWYKALSGDDELRWNNCAVANLVRYFNHGDIF
jgi:hypothetical protein